MSEPPPNFKDRTCPAPLTQTGRVQLAHGGGGRLSQRLIEGTFFPAFANPALDLAHDGAFVQVGAERLAFTTDGYVVRPLFFPGGNIGSLAVHGTVNDLAMCGATPLCLSAAFVLEEGFPIADLERIVASMGEAARAVGVPIVTGDTKVVDRGKGDGVYVTTSGIGRVLQGVEISPRGARVGDRILVSGTLGDHGIAVLGAREGIAIETGVASDSAPLHTLVSALLSAVGSAVHVLRDPTRGGLASALNEIATSSQVGMRLRERHIPVRAAVRGACELLGLDPLYVANEGKCVVLVAPDAAERALEVLRAQPLGKDAADIGEVTAEPTGRVIVKSSIGSTRVLDMLSGEQLPRIC
jgi:hydrogenase expression/formation protein HypE